MKFLMYLTLALILVIVTQIAWCWLGMAFEMGPRGIPAHELRTKYIVYDEDKSRGNIAFDNGKKYSFSYIENTLRIGG